MPSREIHLRIADTLRVFIDKVDPISLPTPQVELAFAAAYWSSLHYLDAVLAHENVNVHPANDGERFEAMRADGKLMKLFRPYRNVKDRYNEALYQGRVFTKLDFSEDIKVDADEIMKATRRMLGLS
jgi:hypothetical protein